VPVSLSKIEKASLKNIPGQEKACATAFLIRLCQLFINLLIERCFSFSFSPEPFGF
jgi:hypothetical protein